MKKIVLLMVLAVVLLLTIPAQAVLSNYDTNDMVWATENGGVLVLSPTVGSGPDITVTFTCDQAYGLGSGDQGITATMVGIGYAYNGNSDDNPTVTFTFSHDVEDVKLSIHDLDSFERLESMSPMPDSVYNLNGDLSIIGDTVQTTVSDVHGDLIYDEILSTETVGFRFRDSRSDIGLVNLQFSAVPEPATLLLFGLGGLLLRKRRA